MLTDATSLDCYAEESEDGLSYSVAIIVSKVDNYVHLWQCIHHSSFHQHSSSCSSRHSTSLMVYRLNALGSGRAASQFFFP